MVLKNWYNAYRAQRAKALIEDGLALPDGSIRDAYYSTSSSSYDAIFFRTNYFRLITNIYGIVVGSGTQEPDFNDYWLQSQITAGLSVSMADTWDDNMNPIKKLTITNTSESAITISEIGFAGEAVYNTSGSKCYPLMERTLLDTPITIPAGGVGTIDYKIITIIPDA